MCLAHSKLSWGLSSPSARTTGCARNLTSEFHLSAEAFLQDTVSVGRKIEVLESHIMQLDILFSTPPGYGNVEELRRRSALILYDTSSPDAQR